MTPEGREQVMAALEAVLEKSWTLRLFMKMPIPSRPWLTSEDILAMWKASNGS